MFDFPTKLDDLSIVPAEFQPLYEQADDGEGFQMIGTLAKRVEDMGGLHDTLGKLRKQVNDQQKQLRAFTAIAKSPEELTAALDAYREIAESPDELRELLAEKDKLIESKDGTKAIEQIKTAHAAELKKILDKYTAEISERDDKATKLRKSLDTEMVESTLVAEIAKQKGQPELLLPVASRFVRVVEDEKGSFVRQVVDRDGDPRVNVKGEPMSISELIAEMRGSDSYARAFDGEGRSGSGSAGGGGNYNPKAKVYTLDAWRELVGKAKPDERKQLLADKAAGKIQVR